MDWGTVWIVFMLVVYFFWLSHSDKQRERLRSELDQVRVALELDIQELRDEVRLLSVRVADD
jgi:hypothetical protein